MAKLSLQTYGRSRWGTYLESLNFPMEIEELFLLRRFVGTLRMLAATRNFATNIQTVYDCNAQLKRITIGNYAQIHITYD